jgi:flagellar hook-associated protein 1 FlgK
MQHLKDLAGLTNITTVEEPNGSIIVSQQGQLLVYFDEHWPLLIEQKKSDDMLVGMPVYSRDRSPIKATDGVLAGQLEARDEILYSYKRDIDALAAKFIWEMNRTHSQNSGLVGYTSITAATRIVDGSVPLNQIKYPQEPVAGTYQIVNGILDVIVHNTNTGENITLRIEIDLDGRPGPNGDPDMILFDPAKPHATNSLVYKLQAALDTVDPGVFEVGVDSANQFFIRTTGQGYEFGFGRDTSGVLAALGLNTLFTGYDGATMGMNEFTYNNPQFLGGAHAGDGDEAFVPGNNQGVWAFMDTRRANVFNSGTTTIDGFYMEIVGRLGTEAARTIALLATQTDVTVRMENQREELSGVNLDEELTKLIQYQRSFQSAASFITTADTLYETLIHM